MNIICEIINVELRFNSPTAIEPKKGDPFAAGYDLYADLGIGEEQIIHAGQRALVPTGLSFAFGPEHYVRIAPRSGLALKHGIDVLAGVIDCSYRGDIGVLLINTSNAPFTVKHGDRIAQAIFEKRVDALFFPTDKLSESARGAGGFGSTGV